MLLNKLCCKVVLLFFLCGVANVFANTLLSPARDAKQTFQVLTTSIQKSSNDHRKYVQIRLKNKLEVLLISDPDLKNSAASLSVPIGSMHNPDTQLGLAHYLEHMLFLGSERYPVINAYSRFMNQNGGYTNAYTGQDITVYGFEVNDNVFEEALDRLGNMMRAPLLDATYADKERHTVNAEQKTYFDNDMRKLYALQRYTLNPKHPSARFSTGDLDTLKDKPGSKLHDELTRFFDTYYSANLMKVVLISPRSITDLEKIASRYLTQIIDKDTKKPIIVIPLITDKERAIKVSLQPTADIKMLQVNFLVPSVKDEYMYQPGGYISRLIGSDHKGGLSDTLRKEGLVDSVMAGFYAPTSENYSSFSVQFKLTSKGLDAQDKIMVTLFSFIDLIKNKGVNELQFQQQKNSLDTHFKFLKKTSAFNYVMTLSADMQLYPIQDILFYDYRLDAFKPLFIKKLLTYLTPENSRIFVLNPQTKGQLEIPHYKGKYTYQKLSKAKLKSWLNISHSIKMQLPPDNTWSPENLSVHKITSIEPVQLIAQKGHSLWFQQSAYLKEPKGSLTLQLNADLIDDSAENQVLMSMFLYVLDKQLSGLDFMTQEAGLDFSLNAYDGLLLSTSGYSDKQDMLLLTLVKKLKNAQFNENELVQAQQEILRLLDNKSKLSTLNFAFDAFKQLMRTSAFSDEMLRQATHKITLEKLQNFSNKLFTQSTLRLLALGNFSKQEVLALDSELKKLIEIQEKPFYHLQRKVAKVTKGPLNYALTSAMQDDALLSVYLTDLNGDKAVATAALLNKLLQPAFYDQIRTQEQLSYSPFSMSLSIQNSVAFALVTQSPTLSNQSLYLRFEAFIVQFKKQLKNVTVDHFKDVQKSQVANYLAKPTSLASEFSYLTLQWLNIRPNINGKNAYIKQLSEITLADVKDFYQTIFIQGSHRQQIIVQVAGQKFKDKAILKLDKEIKISNIADQ
ncbi:insulinase family protein [Psychromonas sp. CD1]|uniref:insulinase family protein n=1 Tax=Psychromonas sp. CD1 TaxID=1979839 RepID=UPI000B9C4429|nr:insulinase family protein [Psychromonas sp. CD1]